MIRMTCNQLVVLADCYRRRLDASNHLGTFNEDVHFLHRHGLVYRAEGDRWRVTEAGRDFVERTIGREEPAAAGEEPVLGFTAGETPIPPPAGVFLVWKQDVGKDGRPHLFTGFGAYQEAKTEALRQVKLYAGTYDTFSHHGTTEAGGIEHFEVAERVHHPETPPRVKFRCSIKHLLFGLPM